LNSAVYEKLREMILANQLRPGQKLAAQHLADELGVSRTPVSQALERLFQEGYVIQVPDRGYFVAEINSREAQDLYHVRIALETHALQVSMSTGIGRPELARLKELQTLYRARVKDNSTIERVLADQNFHLRLASFSNNAYLVNTLSGVFDRLNLKRRVEGYWPGMGNRGNVGLREHEEIIQAIEAGDAGQAQQLLKTHIWEAWVQFEAHLLQIAR
jgi:DNA-binding GntR family transcriptional regulator